MSRNRIAELTQRLREAAKMQDPIAAAAVEVVKLSAEAAKESLVGADGNDMLRHQGAARQFAKLHTELTQTPPSIVAPETFA